MNGHHKFLLAQTPVFGRRGKNAPALVCCLLLLLVSLPKAQARDIDFGGVRWGLRQTSGPVEPGPNTFGNQEDQVWVDELGHAHLTLQKRGDTWVASEMMAKEDMGYGTYCFTVSGDIGALDPNIVFGFFTWDKSSEDFNREIDIEISRWGAPAGPDTWFTVQPYDLSGNQHSFFLPKNTSYTFELLWRKDEIVYRLTSGGVIVEQWRYTGSIPDPGRARLRINLWLFQGRKPEGAAISYEVVVSDFSYVRDQ